MKINEDMKDLCVMAGMLLGGVTILVIIPVAALAAFIWFVLWSVKTLFL